MKQSHIDKQFADICAWLIANKLTMHTNRKGGSALRYKVERKKS